MRLCLTQQAVCTCCHYLTDVTLVPSLYFVLGQAASAVENSTPSFSLQAMAALTDHPYASLTLSDDAAADCLFLRPGLPGATPFLLHRGGGDLPNSQEVRDTQTPPTRDRSLSFPVEERREPFSRNLGGATRNWLEGSEALVSKHLGCPPRRVCRSSLTSPWYPYPAQNWRRLVLASAPSAWCSAHAPTAEGLGLGLQRARNRAV